MSTKYKLPRMSDGMPAPLRRSSFLEGGTRRAFFGPGQRLDGFETEGQLCVGYDGVTNASLTAAIEAGDGTIFSNVAKTYSPPTDWNYAGTLLRPPQVAFLTTSWFNTAFGLSEENYPGTHAVADETGRLMDVFDEVKARIESVRPGKTFVSSIRGYEIIGPYDGDNYITWPQFSVLNQWWPVILPTSDGPFFGVDFLHIMAGFMMIDETTDGSFGRLDPGADASNFYNYPEGGVTDYTVHLEKVNTQADGFRDRDSWSNTNTLVETVAPKFCRYRTQLNVLDVVTGPTDPPFPPAEGTSYPASFFDNQDINAKRLFSIRLANNMASDWGDYFSYGGGTTPLTVDSVVNQIAAHFGFDPETGVDVG